MASVEEVANCIRCLAADIVQGAKSGHPGTPMGMAPVAAVLWGEVMKYNSKDFAWPDRDRFVLSNGHGCALQYALAHLAGYDMSMDDLKNFRQMGAKTPGHPERFLTPSVELTTGPLGQGVANSVGLAIAEAHLAATFNKPDVKIVDHHTYVFCGDGCLMEGVCLEATSLAGHLGLDKLIIVYDSNKICIDGSTDLSFTEDTRKKYEAIGFHVIEVAHADTDFDGLRAAFKEAKSVSGKPKLIIQSSTIGFGSKNAGTEKVHGAPLGDEDIAAMKTRFGRDPAKKYDVEAGVYKYFADHIAKCQAEQKAWTARMAEYTQKYPTEAAAFTAQVAGELPAGWDAHLPTNDKSIATRKASENCLAALFPAIPALMGGSADLTPSNLTRPASANLVDFEPGHYEGRYLRFGVREHAVGAILNGLDAHGGVIPFGATFLNFVGYAIGALRISALCHHRAIWVATHDSIGLGEDGPTHQPVELVAGLRAMPNLAVFRPCDQNETSGAWACAIANARGPSVICLSRQNTQPQSASSIANVKKGAYVLDGGDKPQLVIVASGSEVELAVEAAKQLSDVRVQIVSMPCQELFDAQPESYQKTVFPEGVPVVSVEPYIGFGWDKYSHVHVGMTGFGESAPAGELYKKFGITADHVAEVGRKLVTRFPNGTAPIKIAKL